MNATVAAALTTELTSFQTGVYDQVSAILPLAVPIAITIALVFISWRLFRSLARV